MRKTRNDIITVCLLLVLAISALLVFKIGKTQGKSVEILSGGEKLFSLPLDSDTERIIESKKGSNVLVIKNGKASVRSASCPDKICANHNAISRVGETIVCLPNELVIRVIGEDDGLDANV